jgi:plasmid stabilization system protein ParE
MTHRVVLLASAEQDLKDLRAYLLKNFSSDTWASSYALIKHTIRQLQHFPQAGTILTNWKSCTLRNTGRHWRG